MKKYSLNGEIADFDFHSDKWDFCGPKSLKAFLADLKDGERAEIEINSPGGLVISGVEMANAIKNSAAHIVAHVTGIAASMASVVACACDEIEMEEASFMMIHDPWGVAEGNADEMRKEAQLLDQMKAICMGFYRAKFDRTDEELAALMRDETWYTGAECLANGLKCSVVPSAGAKIAARLTSRHFAAMPEAARAIYAFREMDEATRKEIEAARAAQSAKPVAENWEERFKGASRKINELQAQLADVADTARLRLDAAEAEAKDLKGQLEVRMKDLAQATARVSELSAALEERGKALEAKEKELAEARDGLTRANEQVAHLKETRDVLTGGVLMPPEDGSDYKSQMSKARTAKEREALRRKKARGEIK